MSAALLVATETYRGFLDAVLPCVFSPEERSRGGTALRESQQQAIDSDASVDTRAPFLTRISGKGGWSADPVQRARYAGFANVSLLDHLTGVVRGSLMFAALDLAEEQQPEATLRQRLAVVAVVAFLHDADKMLGLARSNDVTPEAIAQLSARYGVGAFLAAHNVSLTPAQLLALRAAVEVGTAGQLTAVPRHHIRDVTYVRLADRLDGIFLKTHPVAPGEVVGVRGVLREIGRYDMLVTAALKRDWRIIEINDPHTPFLLDAFQAELSTACLDRFDMPPLLEVHHDGRLVMIVPQEDSDALIEKALQRATRRLGASIRLATNKKGKIDLLDAPGTLDDLRDVVRNMRAGDAEQVLRVSTRVLHANRDAIDALLQPYGLLPRTPDLGSHKFNLVPLWTGTASLEDAQQAQYCEAVLINAVFSCTDPLPKLGIPNAVQREQELLALLAEHDVLAAPPPWFADIPPDTCRVVLAALAAGAADNNGALADRLLGAHGLLAAWLEGHDGRPGLASKIDASGVRLSRAVARHYKALLSGKRVVAEDETAEGRCHFTNAPVARSARIDGKTALYGVKVSAFSGREGRPESALSSRSETLVSEIAEAEHRLRKLNYENRGRSADGNASPARVTSPTTAGLFGALAYANDGDPVEYGFYDLLRAQRKAGLTYADQQAFRQRIRVARYEEMPTALTAQLEFVRRAFEAAMRTGRSLHLFRGLPRPRADFVAFDSLPPSIEQLLGGTGFRLEQLPGCVALLLGMAAVAGTTGFGLELALRIADPDTRFGAACDAFVRADGGDSKNFALSRIRSVATTLLEDPNTMKSESDRALVAFGEAMARVQRGPRPDDGGTISELGLRIALETAETLECIGQVDDDSLTAGIIGEIEAKLSRRSLLARAAVREGTTLTDAIAAAADVFVRQVWNGAFNRMVPSSRLRRVSIAVYRVAFEQEIRRLRTLLPVPEFDAAA